MAEHVDELCGLVRIKLHKHTLIAINHTVLRLWIQTIFFIMRQI